MSLDWGFGFRVWGLGLKVWGLGLGVGGLGFGVGVWGLGFGVWGIGVFTLSRLLQSLIRETVKGNGDKRLLRSSNCTGRKEVRIYLIRPTLLVRPCLAKLWKLIRRLVRVCNTCIPIKP